MAKLTDNDITRFVPLLEDAGRPDNPLANKAILHFLCREAARMIRDLRPDLDFGSPRIEEDDTEDEE